MYMRSVNITFAVHLDWSEMYDDSKISVEIERCRSEQNESEIS